MTPMHRTPLGAIRVQLVEACQRPLVKHRPFGSLLQPPLDAMWNFGYQRLLRLAAKAATPALCLGEFLAVVLDFVQDRCVRVKPVIVECLSESGL